MRLNPLTLTIAFLFAGSSALATRSEAQAAQEPSIADAARLNREQKKSAPKTTPVITNDTFAPSPTSKGSAASISEPAPQATQTIDNPVEPAPVTDSPASSSSAQPQLSKEDADRLKGEIAAIKQELNEKQSEVELLQRLLNLDRDAFYSKPDSSRDTSGKAKLDTEQDELKQKSEEFEKLKAKLQSIAPELTSAQAPSKP